ncbi:RNA polymerase factor sigma-54 [Amaricoccus macauensis]|uniref:RNA polymerase factor sigma-54 n=1 Tax=Amaricoccus macauensis TaxID=57001 RepID=UPI003C7A4F0E
MSLSPRLEFRQQQSLVMTPQLQQAIKLLQMSNVELADYVSTEVERNPLLDFQPAQHGTGTGPARSAGGAQGADDDPMSRVAEQITLWEHLHEQIRFMRLGPDARDAALIIADELEEDGYLRAQPEDISRRHRLSMAQIAEGLRAVQSCEPTGVGARTLQECLALQLRERDRLDPAMQALLANLHLSAKGRTQELERVCRVDAEDIADMLVELRELDPKPGLKFGTAQIQVAVPDIFVSIGNAGIQVELNTETLPRVLVDNAYVAELGEGDGASKAFISECRSSANWLVRSLEQRARTILKVASEIALQQERFFSDGVGALRPLTQRTVAERVNLHESTISRVAAGKFLACDQGTFELRYFFSSAIQSVIGGEGYSSTAVQDRIRVMVDAEEPRATLSDDALVTMLKAEGIDIARRTVAKYRGVLGIPSSVQRRRKKLSLSKV